MSATTATLAASKDATEHAREEGADGHRDHEAERAQAGPLEPDDEDESHHPDEQGHEVDPPRMEEQVEGAHDPVGAGGLGSREVAELAEARC